MTTTPAEPQTETLDVPVPDAPTPDTPDTPADSIPSGKPARPTRRRRTTPPTADKKPRAPRATSRTAKPKIAEGMASMYAMAGVAISMVPSDPAKGIPGQSYTGAIGQAFVANAAECGAAWEKAAQENPAINDALEKLLAANVFGQIVAAHLPILLTVGVASGRAPAALVALVMPEAAPA